MHYYSVTFLILAIVAALFGFSGMIVGPIASIAHILAIVFLVLSALFYILHLGRKPHDIPPFSSP